MMFAKLYYIILPWENNFMQWFIFTEAEAVEGVRSQRI